ncbi:MAG: HypC/HybG/HupF family hydrogenase formation chaperone [Gammaproteobacteria bacterium HGW-Gammaproteobacteria-5]|jgi:hydrogenase assembly chaperone HypC/HupF|nr:MAG: HypC/HybG/HupF family hydrogenase formation chaperone [Gammaproteobacteria bacterium HGW-Gammaproteobacteria-5]
MCFAAPAQVVAVGPGFAMIERGSERLPIALHLLDEPVAVGDWLSVQAQRFAVARLSAGEAAELLDLYHSIQQQLSDCGRVTA